jgi:DNA adenine methylase
MKRSRTVIAYYGSKNGIADELVALMPPHRGYVEPFAGSLAVLMAKPPAIFECVNDLDQDLMTFWRVLREQPDELERVCALTPHSRAEYAACWPIPPGTPDLERARRVWVKLSQGRGAHLLESGWRYHEITRGRGSGMPTTLRGYVGRFAAAADRLRGVSLEAIDALELIQKYGRDSETLIYLDPPYLLSTRARKGYKHEFHQPPDHRALAEVAGDCKAMVMLSGYPSPLYDELYADWDRHEIAWQTNQGDSANRARTEVIWANFGLDHGGLFSTLDPHKED